MAIENEANEDGIDKSRDTALAVAAEAVSVRDQLSKAGGPENFLQRAQKAATNKMLEMVAKWKTKTEKYGSEEPIQAASETGPKEELSAKDQEIQALIEEAPDLNAYETLLLKNMGDLVAISSDVLPSLMRLLPAIKSGNIENIGNSPDLPVLLKALKEGIIKDESLRQDMLNLVSDWVKNFAIKTINKRTKQAVPQEVLDKLMQDVDTLLKDPENQVTLLNVILDENILPKIISGEDLDIQNEIKILGALGKKGGQLLSMNHLRTILGDLGDAVTLDMLTNLWEGISDSEEDADSENKITTELIPDFMSDQKNADKIAQFFEENAEQLKEAGDDLPILYLAARAIFNLDFGNPAITALAKNESLVPIMTKLREFIRREKDFQKGILKGSQKGIVMLLKSLVPEGEGRDWQAISEEIGGIIGTSPELQEDYLDFIFLQFDTGAIFEALQGNVDSLKAAQNILNIPFIHTLAGQLSDSEKTPNLRKVITEIGINVGFGIAGEKMGDNEDWNTLEAELRTLAGNPQLQDAIFGLLREENAAEMISGFKKIMTGNFLDGANELLQNDNIRAILKEVREFVENTDKMDEFLLNTAIDNLGEQLSKTYPQVDKNVIIENLKKITIGDEITRENILRIALDPDKLSRIIAIVSNISPDNLGETILELKKIPELKVVIDNLAGVLTQQEGPGAVLRENMIGIVLDNVTTIVPFFRTPKGKELFNDIRPGVEKLLRNSDVLQRNVGFLNTEEGANMLSQIMKNKNNPQKVVEIINSTQELKAIAETVLSLVKTDKEIQNACLDYACGLDERLQPVREFFTRNPEALVSLMDLACNLGNLEELAKLLTPSQSELLVSVNKLYAYPALRSFIDAFTQDFKANPEVWQETVSEGVSLVMQGLKKVVREKMAETFGEACVSKIDKALDRVGIMIASNVEIQKTLIDFASNPGNFTRLAEIVAEIEKDNSDPVKIINLMGSSTELLKVIEVMKTVLLSNPEVQLAIKETVSVYMSNLDTNAVANYIDSMTKADVEAIIDALMTNKDVQLVLDSIVYQISGSEWQESRREFFAKGTTATFNITKALMEKRGMRLEGEKWGTIISRLSTLVGSNEKIQQSMLHLLTDLETARAFVDFGDGNDFSVLRNSDVKNIVAEIGRIFTQDAELWDLLKNTAFDSAYDNALLENPLGLPLSKGDKEDLRRAVIDDLTPGVFDVDKFIAFFENATEMRDATFVKRALKGREIAKSMRLSVMRILRAYLK